MSAQCCQQKDWNGLKFNVKLTGSIVCVRICMSPTCWVDHRVHGSRAWVITISSIAAGAPAQASNAATIYYRRICCGGP